MALLRQVGQQLFRDPFFSRSLQSFLPEELSTAVSHGRHRGKVEAWTPSCDVSEAENEIKIVASLPGVKKEDISVDLDEEGRFLTIAGKTEATTEKKGAHYHFVERSYGDFHRSFQLPMNVDTSKVQAKYENGVLDIAIPKVEVKSNLKKIPVIGESHQSANSEKIEPKTAK